MLNNVINSAHSERANLGWHCQTFPCCIVTSCCNLPLSNLRSKRKWIYAPLYKLRKTHCGIITQCNDTVQHCDNLWLHKVKAISADLLPQLLLHLTAGYCCQWHNPQDCRQYVAVRFANIHTLTKSIKTSTLISNVFKVRCARPKLNQINCWVTLCNQ